jgi:hypothetical protein
VHRTAGKRQGVHKAKELQGNLTEYPIFFSHFVGVKKKMRKAADKFLKESGTMVTSTCRTPLALTLQRKNKATPAMKRKEATHNGNK